MDQCSMLSLGIAVSSLSATRLSRIIVVFSVRMHANGSGLLVPKTIGCLGLTAVGPAYREPDRGPLGDASS